MPEKIILCWSGGKDSALALSALAGDGRYEVVSLLTTVTAGYDRISMHGVRVELLLRQAGEIGLPLEKIVISPDGGHEEYAAKMRAAMERGRRAGVSAVAFGDLFLEDVRQYRRERLAQVGLEAVFPLWGQETGGLARRFIETGFRAILTCVDGERLDGAFAGRAYDEALLADLPAGVDPCGENGEFHTFVHAGPIFRRPVPVRRGEVVLRDGRFWFCDLSLGVRRQRRRFGLGTGEPTPGGPSGVRDSKRKPKRRQGRRTP